MKYQFKESDISVVTEILGVEPDSGENSFTWTINNPHTKQHIVLTLYPEIVFSSDTNAAMVAVQTMHGYFELHNISAFIPFEPDEVIFIHHNDDFLSSLIIGRGATCSMFSNIRRDMLRKDFDELDPATLLSAMQLSIADSIIG